MSYKTARQAFEYAVRDGRLHIHYTVANSAKVERLVVLQRRVESDLCGTARCFKSTLRVSARAENIRRKFGEKS